MRIEFRPSRMDLSPKDYFAEYRLAREAANGAIVLEVDEDGQPIPIEPEPEPPKVTVLMAATEIPMRDLSRSAKAHFKTALDLGMETKAWLSRTEVAPVLFVGDSKEGAASEHQAGDVRFPGHIDLNFAVTARHPSGQVAFQSNYVRRESETTTAFIDAFVLDMVGIPTDLEFHYGISKVARERMGLSEKQAEQLSEKHRAKYNDGGSYLANRKHMVKAGELTEWMDDWLGILRPELPSTSRKAPAPKTEEMDPLLRGGEWRG